MLRNVISWRLATLVALVFSLFLACGGSSEQPRKPGNQGSAGTASTQAGEGGEGAAPGRGGSSAAGRAGAQHGGSSGTFGSGGSVGTGAVGGVSGSTATGGTAGVGASAGSGGTLSMSPPGWTCLAAHYADGTCDCGCGVQDEDCKRDDRVSECERCACAGDCPGRVDPEATETCLPPAAGWLCRAGFYGDGTCDCGCGVVDIDCDDETVESCDECARLGGCGNGPCPSNVVADDNAHCFTPGGWVCEFRYGDGFCDCGCGEYDSDCETTSNTECDSCPSEGCGYDSCDTIAPDENAFCTSPPPSWTCPARLYNDGSQCDCGCGFRDPDCENSLVASCDKCNGTGACSGQACPGTIDERNNQACFKPAPPEGWTCADYAYGDATVCDCGCGVPDPDCRTSDILACETCWCGSVFCPQNIDTSDTTQCDLPPPPDGWTCTPELWSDDYCDCGCGVRDRQCGEGAIVEYCQTCNCSGGRCDFVDEADLSQCRLTLPTAWTCAANTFYDGVCDCGCGALDADCTSAQKSACTFCNAAGSCSNVPCNNSASTIKPDDNTSCN